VVSKKKKYQDKNPFDHDKVTDNPGLINFPHHIGSAIIKPEDKGKVKGRAMAAMKDQTKRQMSQLYEQMKVLAKQANDIKKRIEISEKIYNAQINFEPVINHTYYLYLKNDHNFVLSMIGPEEWGNDNPFKSYMASVKLLSDHTWEILESNFE